MARPVEPVPAPDSSNSNKANTSLQCSDLCDLEVLESSVSPPWQSTTGDELPRADDLIQEELLNPAEVSEQPVPDAFDIDTIEPLPISEMPLDLAMDEPVRSDPPAPVTALEPAAPSGCPHDDDVMEEVAEPQLDDDWITIDEIAAMNPEATAEDYQAHNKDDRRPRAQSEPPKAPVLTPLPAGDCAEPVSRVGCVPLDTVGDGKADAIGLDLNGNGHVDRILYNTKAIDSTGDGQVDAILTDTTRDGYYDTVSSIRRNVDPLGRRPLTTQVDVGQPDAVGVDTTGDGRIDKVIPTTWSLDTTGDGYVDMVLEDTNYDGMYEKVSSLYRNIDRKGCKRIDLVCGKSCQRLMGFDTTGDGRIDTIAPLFDMCRVPTRGTILADQPVPRHGMEAKSHSMAPPPPRMAPSYTRSLSI